MSVLREFYDAHSTFFNHVGIKEEGLWGAPQPPLCTLYMFIYTFAVCRAARRCAKWLQGFGRGYKWFLFSGGIVRFLLCLFHVSLWSILVMIEKEWNSRWDGWPFLPLHIFTSLKCCIWILFWCLFCHFWCIAGKYILVRDANKAQLRLYALPTGVLETAAMDGGDEGEDGEEDAMLTGGEAWCRTNKDWTLQYYHCNIFSWRSEGAATCLLMCLIVCVLVGMIYVDCHTSTYDNENHRRRISDAMCFRCASYDVGQHEAWESSVMFDWELMWATNWTHTLYPFHFCVGVLRSHHDPVNRMNEWREWHSASHSTAPNLYVLFNMAFLASLLFDLDRSTDVWTVSIHIFIKLTKVVMPLIQRSRVRISYGVVYAPLG